MKKPLSKSTPLKLLYIALSILFLSALVIKGVDNSWCSVDVKKASTVSPNGYLMSYKLYIPKSATPQTPAPALIYMVGGGASLDESSMVAVEASRRGYIVIVTDVPGNGLSEPVMGGSSGGAAPVNSMSEGLNYTAESIEIVKSLAMTDKSQLVLAGHSMGAYYTSVMAQKYANEITSCIALGTFGYSGKLDNPTNFNFALIVGKGDESVLYRSTNARTLSDAIQSPDLKTMFGVDKSSNIEIGKVYGNYSNKTARVLYNPNEMHMMEPDSATVAKLVMGELTASTTAPKALSNSNLVYWIKDIAMLLAFLDMGLLLYALVKLLLETKVFSGLVLQRESRYIGYEPKSKPWYIATVILAVLCGCLYILGWQYYSNLPLLNSLGNAGGKCAWSVGTAILLLIFVMIFHQTRGKKNHATLGDYGLATTESTGFSFKYILKCFAFAFTTFAIVYGLFVFYTTFTNCNIHVVLFNSELNLLEPTKVAHKYIPILLLMFTFIFVNAIAQKTIAGNDNNMKKDIIFTNLVGTIAMLLIFVAFVFGLLVPHVCLFAANRGCFGAETLLGVSAGFWLVNISCYYLNKKTNSIWAGTITAAVLMTWLTVFATGMTF
ncbi:alpha/beta hydrolase family protein [Caproicibacterium sp. NSD3]